jgi:hypothetical protein
LKQRWSSQSQSWRVICHRQLTFNRKSTIIKGWSPHFYSIFNKKFSRQPLWNGPKALLKKKLKKISTLYKILLLEIFPLHS